MDATTLNWIDAKIDKARKNMNRYINTDPKKWLVAFADYNALMDIKKSVA